MAPGIAVVVLATAVRAPVVFWASAPVQPGQTVLVCGRFPEPAKLAVGVARVGDRGGDLPKARPARLTSLKFVPVRGAAVTDTALTFQLPDLGGPGMYCVSIRRQDGEQPQVAQVLLNAPEVWAVVSDAGLEELRPEAPESRDRAVFVQPGGRLVVFGRCLRLGQHKPEAVLVAPSARPGKKRGRVVPLRVERATEWYLRLRLPDNVALQEGTLWTLLVSNGYGGAAKWSGPVAVRVCVLPKLPAPPQVYKLAALAHGKRERLRGQPLTEIDATEFGADGYDSSDDGEAIQTALDAAAKAKGVAVVKLPPGRLFVREPLHIPPHTVLQGAGEELTAICIPDTDEPPEAWIKGEHHFAVLDLTVYCSNHKHIIVGDMSGETGRAGHVLLRRVRVRGDAFRGHLKPEQVDARLRAMLRLSTGGGDTVRFSGPDVVVQDCDLYGSGRSIHFHHVRGGIVRGNRLYNGRWGWYNFNVCRGVVIERNALAGADLMSTGGSYSCYGPQTCSENIYTGRNTYRLMHGWDREAFTSDAGGGAYYGGIARVGAARRLAGGQMVFDVELADEPKWGKRPWSNALFAVVGGRGRGFVGRVVAYHRRRVTVEPLFGPRPGAAVWNARLDGQPPADVFAELFDGTSRATVTQMHRHYIFEANEFSDAGIAIQYYGTAIEHVAARNKCWRAGGYHGLGITYAGGVQPDMYCQWLGNEIMEGNSYRFGANNAQAAGPSHLAVVGRAPSINFGAVVRGNTLHNNARLQVLSWGNKAAVENVVVEQNLVRNSDVGFEVKNAVNVVYRDNRFENCRDGLVDLVRQLQQWRQEVDKVAASGRPLVRWSFDKVSGRRLDAECAIPDAEMSARVYGKVELVQGVAGKAFRFDGQTYAEVDSESARIGLNLRNFTIAAWIKPEVVDGRWGIVAKRTRHAATPFVLAIRNRSLVYEATDGEGKWTTYNFAGPPVLKAGQWQHVAVVVEEGKQATLFVNGKPVATNRVSGQKLATNGMPLRIGWEAWGGNPPKPDVPGFFHGAIDELAIWPRALTEEEIRRLAQRVGERR